MPTNPYGHMQLIRLSPDTGKVLNRLNVMQGQVLHGKVYRMEPFSETGGAQGQPNGTGGQGNLGGIAKIALGSQLIEAVVSELIQEGSNVKLEVVRLGEESFTLKLLSVDPPQKTVAQNAAFFENEADQLVLSPETREVIGKQVLAPKSANEIFSSLKLVQGPKLSDLPKPVAQVFRAAVSEGFINPNRLTVNIPAVKSAIQPTIEEFLTLVEKLPDNISVQAKNLAESIKSLARIIRPIIAAIQGNEISASGQAAKIAESLLEAVNIVRPSGQFGPVISFEPETGSAEGKVLQQQVQVPVKAEPGPQAESQPQTQASPEIPTAKTTEGQQPLSTTTVPTGQQQGTTEQGSKAATTSTGPPVQGEPIPLKPGAGILPGILEAQKADQAVKIAAETEFLRQVEVGATRSDREIQTARISYTRNLLLGIRTLATLADRMARVEGWSIEQSATFASYASRFTALGDALEGAILAPLVSHSPDIPDAVPRVLLNLLFPNGHAELGLLQPSDEHHGSQSDDEPALVEEEKNNCIGVIRIRTEALGNINVTLDFREIENESGEKQGYLSGLFRVGQGITDGVRGSLPELERALDARGLAIKGPDGFRVVGIGAMKEPGSEKSPGINSEGGLDIKV